MTLRLGTRASLLATTQSQWVADRVRVATGHVVELVPIVSQGDVLTGSLASLGGTGVFASALRDALLAGECDFVVHSLKDLPTAPLPGVHLAAVPERESARDALCSGGFGGLASLPEGARIGTGSPRRVALAEAGLRRIGRHEEIREVFALDVVPTSAGQGALAIEAREHDAVVRNVLEAIDDPVVHRHALLERAVLARLEAGCAAPLGISVVDGQLIAEVYSPDGAAALRAEGTLANPERDELLVVELVTQLLDAGANEIAPLGSESGR